MTAEALPEWIEVPLLAVFRDLLPGRVPTTELSWTSQDDDAGTLSVSGSDASRAFEKNELSPAALTVEVATWVQESVLPRLAPEAGAQPSCPGHDHAQRAKTLYAVAWWSCPESGTPINVIGG